MLQLRNYCFNLFSILIICHLIFGVPLMYAQESVETDQSTIDTGLDINGLRPEDYDKNGWKQLPNGKWVASPVNAVYRAKSNWDIYDVVYNKSGNYYLVLGQGATGKGMDSKNTQSKQNIFVSVLMGKRELSSRNISGEKRSYHFSFTIKPDSGKKSLHKTFFDGEEDGVLILKDSRNKQHNFDVKIKPGSIVTVFLTGIVNKGVSEDKNKPVDFTAQELISLLQSNDKVNATIQGKKNDWSCNFDIIGRVPTVYENMSATKKLKDLPSEKAAMSTGKKVLIGVGAVILTAAAIYIGTQIADGMDPGDDFVGTAQNFSQADPGSAVPKNDFVVNEVAKEMQKAFDKSSTTGAPYPKYDVWIDMIKEKLLEGGTTAPPRLLHDYAETVHEQASEMVK